MTLYRFLVAVAWLCWCVALASLADYFSVWVRIGAAILTGIGFGELYRAQRRVVPR